MGWEVLLRKMRLINDAIKRKKDDTFRKKIVY